MSEIQNINYGEAIRQALDEEMARDKNVFMMGEDIGRWGGLYRASKGLLEKYGKDQVKDSPISEAAIGGTAVGAALMGMRPIAEIMYIDFITIAMDQMVNHAAKWHQLSQGKIKMPIVFTTQGGAGRRNSSQHSQSFENWFVNVPGLITVMPSTPSDVKGLLKSAIRSDNPVVFIEHQLLYNIKGPVPNEDYTIELGKADIKRKGSDITIVTYSYMVHVAQQAAEVLASQGINVEIIDIRSLYPLDIDTITESVKKTGYCLVLNQAVQTGCFGEHIASEINKYVFDYLDAPVSVIGALDVPPPMSAALESIHIPDAQKVINEVKKMFNKFSED